MSRINKLVKSMRIKVKLSVLWPGQERWLYSESLSLSLFLSLQTYIEGIQLCCGLVPAN